LISVRDRVRHAVVVGASSGVGKLLADALLAQQVVVSTVGRTSPPRREAWHRQCTDLAGLDWAAVYAEAERHVGVAIDAVVYVAGDATFGRAAAIPRPRARQLFEANYWGPVGAATAVEHLWADPRRGVFVSVSSISARRAVPFEAHYCASKAACARFLDALDLEHPEGRLRFTSVYPGRLRTSFRGKADWYGASPDPAPMEGSDPSIVVAAILRVLAGRVGLRVLGTRERAIDLVDRLSPSLYDRIVLRRRVRNALGRNRE
jgi:NAD(P)-dependent dehydrogenase (short-subunit alcohol dehydrogenase family)